MQRGFQHQDRAPSSQIKRKKRVASAVQKRKCGEQDSNLRTVEDCDLNAAPLTKLGDPRVQF